MLVRFCALLVALGMVTSLAQFAHDHRAELTFVHCLAICAILLGVAELLRVSFEVAPEELS